MAIVTTDGDMEVPLVPQLITPQKHLFAANFDNDKHAETIGDVHGLEAYDGNDTVVFLQKASKQLYS